MFKNKLKTYVLTLVCALTLAFPQFTKAQNTNQSIVVAGPFATTYAFTSTDFDLSTIVTASSGLEVKYESSNPNVATIVNNRIHLVGLGSFVLTFSQPGDATYLPAPNLVTTITIVRGFQSINFPAIGAKSPTDGDFDPGAVSTSGLAVTYTSSNPAVATVNGNLIHIVGLGITNITATQAGSVEYSAANSETRVLNVSSTPQTITFAPINKTYLDPVFTPIASASSGIPINYYTSSDPTVATVFNLTSIRIVGVGTATITAYQTGSSTYQGASASTTLTVAKANQSIFLSSTNTKSFDSPDFDPAAVASSNLPITYSSSNASVATIVANKVHITGAGTTIITASQTGNGNYSSAPNVTQNLTVTKANPVIIFPDIPAKPLGIANFDPGATISSGLPITYTSSNSAVAVISGNQIQIVGLGITNITASQAGDANNNPATSVTKQLTVSGTGQSITFPAIAAKVIGDADFALNAVASSGLPITYSSANTSIATIVGNQVHITGAGTTLITATQVGNTDYASASVSRSLTVTKKTQTITFNTLPAKLRSDVDYSPGATASSDLPITYASSNPAVAIIVNNLVHFVGAGTTTITASQGGDASFSAATSQTQNLTVNKGVQFITFPIIPRKTVSDIDFDPGATSNAGLQTTYTSSNTAVATITAGGLVHIVGLGTTTITAIQAGDSNYEPTSSSRTMIVGSLPQVINFPVIPNASIGDADFNPGATSNSGLTISYTSNNPAVATITAGGLIHIVGLGTVSITASQAGNSLYDPAQSTIRTFTVTKRIQLITFPIIPVKTLGDADFPTGASINSGLTINYTSSNPAVATVTGGVIQILSTGTTTITASQPGDVNYEAATSVSRTLTVNGNAIQSVTIPALADRPFNTADFDPGAVSNAGLAIVYSSSNQAVATIVNNRIHIVGIGSTIVTATQPGNINYAAASASTSLNVIKGTATINFPGIPQKLVSSADFELFASVTGGLPITYSSGNPSIATIVNNRVHLVGVGTVVITASHPGNTNYNPGSADQNLIVDRGIQTINFPVIPPVTPSAGDFDPGATINSGLTITYTSSDPTVATIVNGKIHVVGLGTAVITASQAGDVNYNPANDVTRTITIGRAFQSITFPTLTAKTLNTPDFDPGATSNLGLPITYTSSNPAVAIISGGQIHIVGLGNTLITASQAGNVNVSPAADVSRLLYVSASTQVITIAPTITKVFGSPDFNPEATASSGLDIIYTSSNPSVAIIFENKVRIVGVGNSVITASQSGDANFGGATAISNLIITKADQTISFPPIPDKQRNDADFAIGATASSGLTVFYISSNPAVANIIGNRIQITGIGTAVIAASQPGNTNYNVAPVVNQVLTVGKGSQTITFADIPVKALADVDFEPGATVNTGFPITYTSSNPSVATIVNGKIHIVGLGVSTITAAVAGDANFNAALNVSKVLTVKGLSQEVTFAAIPNKKMGDPDFDLNATASTSLPITYTSSNLDVATIVGNKAHIVGIGTTTITATQAGDGTYASATASTTLTVDKNSQTITFPAIPAKELSAADFDPAATASSGLAITYTSSDATVATIVANKVHIVGPGSTVITATQAGNGFYTAASNVSVTLVVNKALQTITFPAIGLKNPTDADFDPNATASSGLAVMYRSSNTAVATIVANKVHLVGAGTTVITASQAGNTTYAAATEVSQNLEVVYTLPVTNFSVKATDETCKTSNNGSINVVATQGLNYTATVIGNNTTTTYPFNTTLVVNNLSARTYNVCITIAGQPSYKQCYDVIIKEPKDLAVYSSIKNDGNSVLLKLEGSDLYRIELNGQVITTTEQEISLPLIKGNNTVKISSDKTCQGVIEKTFLTTNGITLYPNPVKSVLNITTGTSSATNVKVDVHALDGRLMFTSQQRADYGLVTVDLSKLNKGLYVLTLTIGNSKSVHKILKD